MDQATPSMASRLRGIRLEMMTFDERTAAMHSFIDGLFGSAQSAKTTMRFVNKGDTLMSRLVEDDLSKRLDAIERRLDDLETDK